MWVIMEFVMKNNKYFIWLQTEYKRAAVWLPLILKRTIIFMVLCITAIGMVVFCGKSSLSEQAKDKKAVIGYVAPNNVVIRMAVSYVENMPSIDSICTLKRVELSKGKELLKSGEIAALIELPENVIEDILSGKNTPAKLYLADTNTVEDIDITGLKDSAKVVGAKLIKELAQAGIGMLQNAQAQIYTVSYIDEIIYARTGESMSQETYQRVWDDINTYNLSIVINREDIFKVQKLSITQNNSVTVYYAGAVIALIWLMLGVIVGEYAKRTPLEQVVARRKLGIEYIWQIFSKVIATVFIETVVVIIGICGIWISSRILSANERLSVHISMEMILILFVLIVFNAIYIQLVYLMAEKAKNAILIYGISAVFQGYMSGCIIPSVLLTDSINKIGKYLPANYVREAFTVLFTNDSKNMCQICIGLSLWSIVFFLFAWFIIGIQGKNFSNGTQLERNVKCQKIKKLSDVNTQGKENEFVTFLMLNVILFRRLYHQKSMWICLVIIVVASLAINNMETNSKSDIRVVVCDKSGLFEEKLSNYEGLISFDICADEKEIEETVLRDKAECGYVIPKNIVQYMSENLVMDNSNPIILYEDNDTMMSAVVNEIVFNIIYEKASVEMFKSYIYNSPYFESIKKLMSFDEFCAEFSNSIQDNLTGQISANKTFSIDIVDIRSEADVHKNIVTSEGIDNKQIFPPKLVVLAGVILCFVQGVIQVITDNKKHRFYKADTIKISVITIAQPVLLGVIMGMLCLMVI